MRKKSCKNSLLKKYLLISVLILAVALVIASVINVLLTLSYKESGSAEHVISMLEGVIGAISIGLILYQLRSAEKTEIHQNKIEEATFLLQYNQPFVQDEKMTSVERLLEEQAYYDTETREILTPDRRQMFVNYLVYLESFAPLILNKILKLEYVDDVMAYRFFLALENAELQEKEIKPFATYYRGCFKLYKVWKEYRCNRGLDTPCGDCKNKEAMRELSDWDQFEQYASEVKCDRDGDKNERRR